MRAFTVTGRLLASLRGRPTYLADVDKAPADSALPEPILDGVTGPWRNVVAPPEGGPYTCPCCGHRTLPERGLYDWCPECGWEDDGQDNHDSDVVRLGPNGAWSLQEARAVYLIGGGSPQRHDPPELDRG